MSVNHFSEETIKCEKVCHKIASSLEVVAMLAMDALTKNKVGSGTFFLR